MTTERTQLLATAFYSIITLGILGPLHPTQEIWGGDVADVRNHLHVLYWQGEAASSGRPLPVHDALLHYPDGGTVFVADPIGTTLVIPLVWVAGPVFAANALIFLSLVFACWSMFWLVRRLTGDTWVAFFSGLVFGLSPITIGHTQNGVWELLQTGWLPLFVGCLLTILRIVSSERAGHDRANGRKLVAWQLAAAATWSAAAIASHWYYGMYAGLLFGLLVLVYGIGPGWWRTGAHAGVTLATTAVFILPAAYLFVRSTHSELSITRGLTPGSWAPFKVADAAFFFEPRPPEIETFLHLTYPCGTILVVAVACLAFGARRKQVAGWLGASSFFAALSFGPSLVWHDEAVRMGAASVLLPHRWFSAIVPLFDSMEFPYRFFVMVHLCLAIAVGLGLAVPGPRRALKRILLVGLGAVYVLELSMNSGAPVPMDRQVIDSIGPTELLKQDPDEFAVFDLPIRLDSRARHRYVVNQLFHGRPVLYSNFPTAPFPFTASLARGSLVTNLFRTVDDPQGTLDSPWSNTLVPPPPVLLQRQARELSDCLLTEDACDPIAIEELLIDLERLAQHRITRFALHLDFIHPQSQLPDLCELLFGPPRWRTDDMLVHVLEGSNLSTQTGKVSFHGTETPRATAGDDSEGWVTEELAGGNAADALVEAILALWREEGIPVP